MAERAVNGDARQENSREGAGLADAYHPIVAKQQMPSSGKKKISCYFKGMLQLSNHFRVSLVWAVLILFSIVFR